MAKASPAVMYGTAPPAVAVRGTPVTGAPNSGVDGCESSPHRRRVIHLDRVTGWSNEAWWPDDEWKTARANRFRGHKGPCRATRATCPQAVQPGNEPLQWVDFKRSSSDAVCTKLMASCVLIGATARRPDAAQSTSGGHRALAQRCCSPALFEEQSLWLVSPKPRPAPVALGAD